MTLSREFLESNVSAAQIPGGNVLLAALAGIPIEESPYLAFDEMAIAVHGRKILVGEQRHFLYRMKMLDLNREAREAAAAHIQNQARRILGEDWKLSPK